MPKEIDIREVILLLGSLAVTEKTESTVQEILRIIDSYENPQDKEPFYECIGEYLDKVREKRKRAEKIDQRISNLMATLITRQK